MEELEDEYEYVVLRDDIAKLKKVYLNDIRNSVLLSDSNIPKLITTTFIINLKELQDKYLSFVQKYIYEELEYVNQDTEECLRMIENIINI
jgi:hypothetical protein